MINLGSCPANINKLAAVKDYKKNDKSLLNCYCYNRIVINHEYTSAIKDKFQDVFKGNKQFLCAKWYAHYLL